MGFGGLYPHDNAVNVCQAERQRLAQDQPVSFVTKQGFELKSLQPKPNSMSLTLDCAACTQRAVFALR